VRERVFRPTTEVERAFLRVVTSGHPEIESQIESCQIADYDSSGWCDVLVSDGRPSPEGYHVDGPQLKRGDPENPSLYFSTMFSLDDNGMLTAIEFIVYRGVLVNPYETVLEAKANGELVYPEP